MTTRAYENDKSAVAEYASILMRLDQLERQEANHRRHLNAHSERLQSTEHAIGIDRSEPEEEVE